MSNDTPPTPDFISVKAARERRNLRRGTAYNRADLGISIKVNGRRWVHARGLDALEENDTGAIRDAQVLVSNMRNTD
jgi:hypothetical protein